MTSSYILDMIILPGCWQIKMQLKLVWNKCKCDWPFVTSSLIRSLSFEIALHTFSFLIRDHNFHEQDEGDKSLVYAFNTTLMTIHVIKNIYIYWRNQDNVWQMRFFVFNKDTIFMMKGQWTKRTFRNCQFRMSYNECLLEFFSNNSFFRANKSFCFVHWRGGVLGKGKWWNTCMTPSIFQWVPAN